MNETMQQIVSACVPVLCLLITAGGAYAVALLRRETAKLQKELDNETANKYMDMAMDRHQDRAGMPRPQTPGHRGGGHNRSNRSSGHRCQCSDHDRGHGGAAARG